jgi:hypothetical protein
MPRDRRAAQPWPSESPERTDFAEPEQKWESLTDTGSMQPSPEALAWQRRADAWAQQPESDSQAVEPANRWSEVASTGRTAFPADGVGWRTETAEWRATGARWRQTTEWRSTTGTHGWRSTTEAWQSGGASSYDPPAETPSTQPAISSTPWSADQPADEGRPAWQQFTGPAQPWEQQQATPSWQQPSQRPPAESSPSWQQLVDDKSATEPPRDSTSRPSWQRDAIEGTATWNDAAGSTKDSESMSSWLRMDDPAETPSWQTPRDDGRHLVREDDRAAWRRDAELGGGSPPVGRRRAPEGDAPRPSGGTGWAARSDSDHWAGHADTGNIQLYPDPPTPTTPTWAGADPEARRYDDGSAVRRALPSGGYDDPARGASPYGEPTRRSRHTDPGADQAARSAGAASAPMPLSYDTRPGGSHAAEPAPGPRRGRYADDAPPVETPRGYPPDTPGYGRGAATGYPAEPPAAAPTTGFGRAGGRAGRGASDALSNPGFGSGPADTPAGGFGRRGAGFAEPPSASPTSSYGRGAASGYATEPPPAPNGNFGRGAGLAEPPSASPTSSYGRGAGLAEPPSATPPGAFGRGAGLAEPRSASPAGGFGRGAGFPEPPAAAPTSSYGRGAAGYPPEPPAASAPGFGRGAGLAEPPSAPTSSYGRGAGLAEPPAAGPTGSYGRGAGAAEPPSAAPTSSYGRGAGVAEPPAAAPTSSFGRGAGFAEPPAAAPTSSYGRGAVPAYPTDQPPPGGGRRRGRDAAEPFADEAAARSGPGGRRSRAEEPPAPAGRGGKARYNEVHDDWREHTGSWSAEPDTSSWVRDPDTGQWSRSDDDPRVLAWREEAARRDSMNHAMPARRELPAGPAKPEPPADDWRGDAGPSSSPRSAMPAAPRSGMPASPRSAMPAAPRSGMPSSAPRSATPFGPRPDDTPGYPDAGPTSTPRSGTPYGTPRRELPSGRARPDDTGFGAAPASGPSYGGTYGSPRRELPSGRARPDDTGFGAAPTSGPSYGGGPGVDGFGRSTGPAYGGSGSTYGSAAGSGPAYGGGPGGPSYGSRRALPSGRSGTDDPAAYRNGSVYDDEPGNASRSGPPYGDGPGGRRGGTTYGDSPPRNGTPYGGPPFGDGPGGAPRGGTPYGDGPGSAPRSGTPYGGPADYRAGVRHDDDDEPSIGGGRRRADYDDEPMGPDSWRRTPDAGQAWPSRALGAAAETPPWSRGGAPADPRQRPEPGDWRLEFAEPAENGHGAAAYRDGGGREAGGGDWRQDLSDGDDLGDGESRRYGTSDYVPFRSGGAAAVPRSSNLSMTSTSLISPVPREQRDPMVRPQRSGNGIQQSLTGSYERRPVTGGFPMSRRSDLLDPDDEEGDQDSGGTLAAIGYTVIWYGVPIVLFVVYMLVIDTGSQSHALGTLAKAAPQFLISLVLSVLVALGLRKFSSNWKAISVGLAAAVVGGGLATVLSSAITGNSLS